MSSGCLAYFYSFTSKEKETLINLIVMNNNFLAVKATNFNSILPSVVGLGVFAGSPVVFTESRSRNEVYEYECNFKKYYIVHRLSW